MRKFLAGFLVGDCAPLNLALQPLLLFGFRFYVAYVFFKSGLTKVDDNFKITSSTIDLFKYDFKVPVLPPEIAAYLATYAELILPVLLVLGFLSRPAALGLFILNAVAAFSLAQTDFASAAGHWQHVVWGVMLAVVFAFGPGRVSIDRWISDKLSDEDNNFFVTVIMIAILGAIGYFLATKYL
ncbi:MAG: DoxX family protein [Cocleimonas sp.]